jgi:hypothetical protein
VVTLNIPEESLQIYSHGITEVIPGTYQIDVGSSSSRQPIHLSVNIS